MPSTMFRDYLECVIGVNQPMTKKAGFINSYLGALSGKVDMRAQDKKTDDYRLGTRGVVGDRVREKNYKYSPLSSETYGITPRKLTTKAQRDRD